MGLIINLFHFFSKPFYALTKEFFDTNHEIIFLQVFCAALASIEEVTL
jgi:hypothetical protein